MAGILKSFSTAKRHRQARARSGAACLGLSLLLAPALASAQEGPSSQPGERLQVQAADSSESGTAAVGRAAERASKLQVGLIKADLEAKAAADRARSAAEGTAGRASLDETARATVGNALTGPANPSVVGGLNFAGLTDNTGSPPDTTGAIGTTRFVQLVNRRAGIFNRTTGALISSGTLNQLAGVASTVNSFDPQIIWDPTTNRFYYTMDSIHSSSSARLSFGFSRTSSPLNVTTDWCHYQINFGTRFPDYPKLGDSQFFLIIGVNSFNLVTDNFIASDLIGISKPLAGTTCPAASTFKVGRKLNLLNSSGSQVFTPVPANQIDTAATGYVVARNLSLPSNRLWFYSVARNSSTGFPIFGGPRGATVAAYASPPNATQPNFPGGVVAPTLDTLDARPTQAVQAIDPRLRTFSFWTQHTIANGSTGSAVRWYEINPVPATPVVQRQANIASPNVFYFNAAISPDRRVDGATRTFGNNFVIEYNVSSRAANVSPRIVAGSSVNGAALTFLLVRNGVGPYRDFTCTTASSVCRWGDYSGATPDPRPTLAGRGQVWGTNQFSGILNPPVNGVNWRTRIFNLAP